MPEASQPHQPLTGKPATSRPNRPKELRLLDLAYCLLDLPEGRYKTREQLFDEIPGYREHGYDLATKRGRDAFRATFENDKRDLRGYGFAVVTSPDNEGYRIDADRTFMGPIELDDLEMAKLTCAANEMLASRTFPLKHDLRIALAKVAGALDWQRHGDDAQRQANREATGSKDRSSSDKAHGASRTRRHPRKGAGRNQSIEDKVANLRRALALRKELTVSYCKPGDAPRPRTIRPYGDYSYKGAWYVVVAGPASADDTGPLEDPDNVRILRVDRMGEVPWVRSVTPDYQIPEGFSIEEYPKLPFEMGRQNLTGRILISASVAPFAASMTLGKGALSARSDGSLLWEIPASDATACASWCIENGPGIVPIAPTELVDAYGQMLTSALEAASGPEGSGR